ncbi:homoserine O-acetyltransferase domain protein [Mycobacterium xenopi 3993]|nr:homoserine O-acetyltransferase domain protein [Mycobacterium xenopi 3993]
MGLVDIGSLRLESGAVIDDVCIAVQRWGNCRQRVTTSWWCCMR